MIKKLMGLEFVKEITPEFIKYHNAYIEVFFENNRNIAVFDKIHRKLYCDLKSAYLAFSNFKELS